MSFNINRYSTSFRAWVGLEARVARSNFHNASAIGHSPTMPRTSMGSVSHASKICVGEFGTPAGLHQQIATPGQAEDGRDIAGLLDDPEVTGVEVASQARPQGGQRRQEE